MSSHGPSMDVKVLYTLDSSPNHTMVARLGRPVPVEVIIPNMTPPSPLEPSGSNYHPSPPSRHVRFGRIALKACLGAVCMASPELLPDDKRDYIIYAVDPEETMRAQQLGSPSSRGQVTPVRASSSMSSRDRHDASSSKHSSSPSRPKDAPTSILVGKGFFNWALDEEGDGETTVTGRVRSDGRRLRYENGREYEEDINVLEVVIKLKESQARNKDKYFNLVRGLSSGSSFSAGSSTASSSASTSRVSHRLPLQDDAMSAPRRFRTARHIEDQSLSLHSEPDYPTSSSSSYGTMERQIRRPAARPSSRSMPMVDKATERILSPKTAPLGASPSLPALSSFSATASSPAVSALSPNAAALSAAAGAAPNQSTMQLLTILHSLQQRSSKSAPEPAQQAQLENLLSQVAQALGNSSTSSPAADSTSLAEPSAAAAQRASTSPALSARPLDSISVPNSRSPMPTSESSHPGKENRLTLVASKDSPQTGHSNSRRQSATSPSFEDEDASSPSVQRKDSQDTTDRICYNCGTDVPTTWRILKLPAGSTVNNPSAEKGSSSDGTNDDSNEPGWRPRYADNEGPIQTDGETKWSACNPCGLYYLKWNNSRPEYVWRKEHATKVYRDRKEAMKRQRENEQAGSSKRSKVANSDVDAASPYTTSTPRDANTNRASFADGGAADESMTSPNFDAATPGSSSGRKSSMPRTLSEACHRDAEKLESQRSSKKKEKEKPVCKKQADREYVLDPSTGKWRSRRSMRENPAGKRPGRPKGSVKVPQNGKAASKSSPIPESRDDKDDAASTKRPSASKQAGASTSAQASTSKATAHGPHMEFRAPMPPQRGRQIPSSRVVNFAQSSPVRPSMNASLMQPDAVNALPSFGSGLLASPSRDVRFRVPSYLMNSSPGTMLDTLMSEADFDFEELGPLGPLQTPGTLLGNLTRNGQQTPSMLRRSPRKNPHGTISGQNPYASPSSKRSGSPSLGRDLRMSRSLVDENGSPGGRNVAASSSNNNSPVTRSRTRSGQDVLHPALFSSSDDPSNENDKSSSTVTSPASPSEKVNTGKVARSKSKITSSLHSVGKSQISSRKGQVEASARRGASADVEADDEDNGPEAQFVKGPYRKSGTESREGSAGLPSCPASPSLGRATRKLTRNLSAASNQSLMQNGPAKLAQLDLPPSSPVFDHPTGRSSSTIEVDGWGRTPSMREIFPTPSDLDWPSDASPGGVGSQSPIKNEKVDETLSTATMPASKETAIVRRRPLPATVEDGSSSVSGSSPALSDDSPEAGNGNVFDLLEDPYGILAASGFGIDADGTLTSLEIPVPPPSGPANQMTPTSTTTTQPQPAITADNFNEIQLHQSKEFGTHLTDFNSSGGVGIAAHVAGSSGTAAAVQIANAPSSGVEGLDAAFLATLPPELSNIFASPKKPIPPQIIEILASPRRSRTRGSTISPTKGTMGGELVPSPSFAPGTEGQLNEAEQQDFSALFSNPDIQALLAEFEASA
ncbi:Zinc finger, NHR/GATA-type [Kalmanozyma brasiliensis GHG001]|uniref:GATA-type domain-containing protein n=1 Tax=Kalmanozyma brasiliensis (strain GHG001) TaxID=1365824 RepID=V5GEM4_KALBG|nr:Zinc finger, NHR/GATA-type [Kalmanozyma brasiliensis GHG001]EST04502.1 Zinc finger, NHR/GATA-type [Kalmanozyma brasiliensis GHG001]